MIEPRFDNTYARLPGDFFAEAEPAAPPRPALIRLNEPLAKKLGLDASWLASEAGLAMLSGKRLPSGAQPIAMAYAGHQFGGWVPRLGDGRAILIGEVVDGEGRRYDLQLKGAGRTRFSRSGDGRAVLGPVLREYVVSEAMAALGVPTTRALSAVTTGERVLRNGPEPGAVLTRVAQSHVRVGTFQYFQESPEALRTLADYVVDRHYPETREADRPHRALFTAIVERQAQLIAHWMALGFIHGVMNTDNMQIAGDTIDYGPCAFIDRFHPQAKFSAIDRGGRYAWKNQPSIATWNLARLAEALLPLFDAEEDAAVAWAEAALSRFHERFASDFARRFRAKLGLSSEAPGHDDLVESTFVALTEGEVDFTLFFRHLTSLAAGDDEAPLRALFSDRRLADTWLARWRRQLGEERIDPDARVAIMRRENPVFIPRNHRIEQAIEAAGAGRFELFHRLVEVLARPYDDQPAHADLEEPPAPHEVVHQTFCGT